MKTYKGLAKLCAAGLIFSTACENNDQNTSQSPASQPQREIVKGIVVGRSTLSEYYSFTIKSDEGKYYTFYPSYDAARASSITQLGYRIALDLTGSSEDTSLVQKENNNRSFSRIEPKNIALLDDKPTSQPAERPY